MKMLSIVTTFQALYSEELIFLQKFPIL